MKGMMECLWIRQSIMVSEQEAYGLAGLISDAGKLGKHQGTGQLGIS